MTARRDLRYRPTNHAFDAQADTYHGPNALCMAVMANLAYENKAKIQRQTARWGFGRFHFFAKGGTEAFIVGDAEKVIVAFRGTKPTVLKDWRTDVRFRLVKGPVGKVHRGFRTALGGIWPALRPMIRSFQDDKTNPQSLWLTGHSLGAGLATLAYARLRFEEDKPVHGLTTFGQPRTGNGDFAAAINRDSMARMYRLVNNSDLVPRLPPRSLGYSHAGRLVYFTSAGRATSDMSVWMRVLDRARGRLDDLGKPGPDAINDHDMSGYVKLVRKNMWTTLRW